MKRILQALQEAKVNEYTLVEEVVHGKEWFFIGKKLDLSRAKQVRHFYLTIYQTIYESNERYKGSASCKISDCADEKQISQAIASLVEEAGYVRNPYYELPQPSSVVKPTVQSLGEIQSVFETMADFHEDEHLQLNSYELFETMHEVHIVNSKGIDVKFSYPGHELEMIINAKDESHEIEIYQDMRFGQTNLVELKYQIGEAKRQAQNRLKAITLTKQHVAKRVILSQENVLEIFRYYLYQLRTDAIYRQYSSVKVGEHLGPKHFTLESLVSLENSSMNYDYDREGRACRAISLVSDGIVENVWGSHVFSSYLGYEDTTMVYNYKVSPGSMSVAEMKKEPYLEIVQFSDFSCHPITGDFSGEIRLGYYFDGEKITVVSNGSLSGNIKVNEPTMVFSNDLKKYNNAVVPSAILLDKVSIACE